MPPTYNPAAGKPKPISTTGAVTHALFMEGMTFCGYPTQSPSHLVPRIIHDDIAQVTCPICQHSPGYTRDGRPLSRPGGDAYGAVDDEPAEEKPAEEKPAKKRRPPARKQPKARASKADGLPDPQKVFAGRTDASQSADLSKQNTNVITPKDPAYTAWVRDGGVADIKGVDTKVKSSRPTTDKSLRARSAAAASSQRSRSKRKAKGRR